MPIEANEGSSYHRPRFRFDASLTPRGTERVLDARVELIVELIAELTDERRVQLARRLAELDRDN